MNSDLYGRGISYPLQINVAGGIRESADAQKIRESIFMILGTQQGERLMRPLFGCSLKSLAFAPNNEATANLARYYVEDALSQWEPRIEVLEVMVQNDTDEAALRIFMHYRIRATLERQTMPYTFLLEQSQ